jgi:hypothetical protein
MVDYGRRNELLKLPYPKTNQKPNQSIDVVSLPALYPSKQKDKDLSVQKLPVQASSLNWEYFPKRQKRNKEDTASSTSLQDPLPQRFGKSQNQ